jgi:peptidoglycan/LPS O-acetylase OafA/YrhL
MYWLAIPLYLVFAGYGEGFFAPTVISPPQIASTALFLSAIYPIGGVPVVPGGLTVTTEVAFYALFPLFVLAFRTRLLALFAVILSVKLAVKSLPLAGMIDAGFWLPCQLPVFLIGMTAFLFARTQAPILVLRSLFCAAVVALFALPFLPQTLPIHIEYAIAFGVILYCLANGVGSFIATKPIQHLGKISFGVYLLHFFIFDLLYVARQNGFDPFGIAVPGSAWRLIPFLAFVLIVVVAVSSITYRTIELPMIALGNQLIESLRRKSEPREQVSERAGIGC